MLDQRVRVSFGGREIHRHTQVYKKNLKSPLVGTGNFLV